MKSAILNIWGSILDTRKRLAVPSHRWKRKSVRQRQSQRESGESVSADMDLRLKEKSIDREITEGAKGIWQNTVKRNAEHI